MSKNKRFAILLTVLVIISVIAIKSSYGRTLDDSSVSRSIKLAKLEKQLKNQVEKYGSTNVDIAIQYQGQVIEVSNNESVVYPTASVVKTSIAAQIMHTYGDPKKLSKTAKSNMKFMMEKSNNDATTWLLAKGLGSTLALNSIFESLEMSNSRIDAVHWGTTIIPASDQLKVLDAIFNKDNPYLNLKSQAYIQKLMNKVSEGQNWGISNGSKSKNVYIKNGWLDVTGSEDPNNQSNEHQTWIINSIGYIKIPNGEDYSVAIMTNNNESEQSGIQITEDLGKKIHDVLK